MQKKKKELGQIKDSHFEQSSQLIRNWDNLLQDFFENEFLITNPLVRTEGRLLFAWCVKDLPAYEKIKLEVKGLNINKRLALHKRRVNPDSI